MTFHFYLGLDLGQSSDFTALAVIEEGLWVPDDSYLLEKLSLFDLEERRGSWVPPGDLSPFAATQLLGANYRLDLRPEEPALFLRHLERFELGTRYTAVAEGVKRLLSASPFKGKRTILLIDKTGVGAGVFDHFIHSGVGANAITIHGGSTITVERQGYRVPKRDLVAAVQVPLQNGRLKIAKDLELAETLRKELLGFSVKVDPRTAHDSYEHWREKDHDDLVLATAMACWFRQWWNYHLDLANAKRRHLAH
jgi:hypothetical protein